mmetsp:Transcript_10230/g.9039  ORF Transcript_10230/g.9039 Transcript_10230/m.9039 type:complete len:94 (+) Transcript_10230:508-789(+)
MEEYNALQVTHNDIIKLNETKGFELLEADAKERNLKKKFKEELKNYEEKLSDQRTAIRSIQKAISTKKQEISRKKDRLLLEIDKLEMALPVPN